jgi:hypothetical protein
MTTARPTYFTGVTRACARAREGQSKVGKSSEAAAKVGTDSHSRSVGFIKAVAPAGPNLSESQKGGCAREASP